MFNLVPFEFFNKVAYVPKNAKVEIKGRRLFVNDRLYSDIDEDNKYRYKAPV